MNRRIETKYYENLDGSVIKHEKAFLILDDSQEEKLLYEYKDGKEQEEAFEITEGTYEKYHKKEKEKLIVKGMSMAAEKKARKDLLKQDLKALGVSDEAIEVFLNG